MATNPIGGSPPPVTFPNQLSPRALLLLMLSGVRTLDQWRTWAEDFQDARCLLECEDEIELACFGGWRRADIELGQSLREFI